uniref:Uncharacterized protein n=1 Tax=Kalanchoe fedtschenkoi TaxID=63787 RepID=A0A7N0UD56_KALFE
MDVEKLFHMNGGNGNTSYAKNSALQLKASDMMKHVTAGAIRDMYRQLSPTSVGMADLGCSSGPNTLAIVRKFIDAVKSESKKVGGTEPELRIYLNDLPSNDFNSIFQSLPGFYGEMEKQNGASRRSSVFIAACAGSFYDRLFPNNSIHFVYSSYCLHWLSKVPLGLYDDEGKSINKGSVSITAASPPEVSRVYYDQFKQDFSSFLRLRSEEVVAGGRMVLIFLGRGGSDHIDRGNSFLWELLRKSFAKLASEGKIAKEKLDEYEVHFYAPSKEEVEEQVVEQGDFKIEEFEMFDIENDGGSGSSVSYGRRCSAGIRAVQESMISRHFGQGIVDDLFENYCKFIDEEIGVEKIRSITFLVVLRKM